VVRRQYYPDRRSQSLSVRSIPLVLSLMEQHNLKCNSLQDWYDEYFGRNGYIIYQEIQSKSLDSWFCNFILDYKTMNQKKSKYWLCVSTNLSATDTIPHRYIRYIISDFIIGSLKYWKGYIYLQRKIKYDVIKAWLPSVYIQSMSHMDFDDMVGYYYKNNFKHANLPYIYSNICYFKNDDNRCVLINDLI